MRTKTTHTAVLLAAVVLAAQAAEDSTAKPPMKSPLPAADAGIPSGPPGGYPIGWPAFERLDLLPLLPPSGTQTKQFISYDTSGGNGWGFRHFKRYEQNGEWVFFDEIGPGCLYRLQMNVFRHLQHPADEAHIRFRFDDEAEPRIDMTFAEFFGKHHKYVAPFTPPLAYFDMIGTQYTKGGGFAILYHPFSFRKRLRISAWHPKGLQPWGDTWYQFTYLKYPSGTEVRTWPGRDSDSAAVRTQWENNGADPLPVANRRALSKSVTLKKGETAALLDERGAGVLTGLRLTMKPWTRDTFYKVRLRVTWDDHAAPMLDLPVGCLFGGGGDTVGKDVSLSKLTTLMFGYDGKAGTGYSYWPMPFRSRARVEVVNESGTDLESFGLGVERGGPDPAYPAGDAGYLAVTRTLDASPLGAHYSRAFRQRGYGKVVGLMMYSSGFNMDGDEFTYFDGSKTPQIHGDGTEDDHNQGWGGYAIQKPLWGGLINGFDGAYRLYLAEPYVFQNEVRITYEHSNWGGAREGEKTDFVVWSYLGTPGMGNLVETDMVDIGDAAGEQAHQFKVEGQTWAGRTKASYDKYEQGDPFPTEDDGIAFTNRIEFTVRIDPGNDGVRLRRRLNRHTANVQLARVFVDGQEIADTPWYFCDLPTPAQTAFADNDFEIPARYTRGKKRVAVRIEHVRAEPANANNAYRFTAFCYGRKPLPPPPPDPASEPLEVQATATPRGSVAISWKPGMESPADDFTVQRRSGDGGDFKTLVQTRSNETAFVDQDTRFFGQYRYRIRGETAGGPSVWRESNPVLVLPAASNRLDGAIASASSMWDATYSPAKACDGDLTTRWNSAQGAFADQWLAFDLKKPERLNTVVVYQETTWTRIAKHEVQARIGGEWKTVFEGDAMPDIEVCRFAPVETDGIRIRMTKTTGNSPTIKEVQAFLAKAIEEKP